MGSITLTCQVANFDNLGFRSAANPGAVTPAVGPGPPAGDRTLLDGSGVMRGHTEVRHVTAAAGQTDLLPLLHAYRSSLLPFVTPFLPLSISGISLLIHSEWPTMQMFWFRKFS